MKILYISSEYPPQTGFGGIATYTMYMAEAMASMGHQVHVICRAIDREIHSVQNGVNVHRVPCGPYPLPEGSLWYQLRRLCYKTISQSLNRLAWAGTVYKECIRLSENDTFDVIEYPECGAEGYYLTFKRLPLVVRLHTPWTMVRKLNQIKEHPLDCWLQKYLERRSITHAKAVTSPSSSLAGILKKKWRIRDAVVFPNPIPVNRFKSEKNNSRWIYTGRLEHRKGVHLLVKAYQMVCRIYNPPQLLLVGRGYGNMPDGKPYQQYIKDLVSELSLEDKISIIEGVNQSEIPYYLQTSSVAFFPSLWENHPYSCLEAMAAKTAVCCSNCGGFPEIIEDGKNGVLFNCNDYNSLAEKMKWFLENKEATEKLALQAHQHIIDKFNPEQICKRALQVYESIRLDA
jgi:glycosyltransferase involved in cell wall biosynthesis